MKQEKKIEKIEEKVEETKEVAVPVVEEPVIEIEKAAAAVEVVEEEESAPIKKAGGFDVSSWNPKTELGKKVKAGEIVSIEPILEHGKKILESEIVDILLSSAGNELLMIGQSKGKFGGGARRVFKQTQKKTPEGNKPSFSCIVAFGNKNGIVGVGYGKSKDTVPAREKAMRKSKINIFKIRRGCGSWECGCKTPHSIPFHVEGKCGSVRIELIPAPKGKGLCVEQECAKILQLAGIKDVWSKTSGQTRSKINIIYACIDALKKLNAVKVQHDQAENVGMKEGIIAGAE